MSESGYEPTPSAVWYELQARLQTVCDEQDALYRREFEEVFAVMDDDARQALNTVGWNMEEPVPVELEVTTVNKALQRAGKTGDTAFYNDFWRYCNLTLKGKRLQREMGYLNAREVLAQPVEPQRAGAWVFAPLHVIASPQLHGVIADTLHDEATHGRGLFANRTYTPVEDESEDEFTIVEVYDCRASLLPYLDELKEAGILEHVGEDVLISGEFKVALLQLLKELAVCIKEHTDRPAAVRNVITECLRELDDVPVWGLILQILTLQGLSRWLEGVNVDEGDSGFVEVQSLYNWLCKSLAWKLAQFYYTGSVWSEADLKRLQPLGDYLCNTTVGAAVQQTMRQRAQAGGKAATSAPSTALPPELNNDEAKEILARARALELVEESEGKWHWRGSKRLLAYFSREASKRLQLGAGGRIAWQPFEELFDVEAGTLKHEYNPNRDGKPRGYEQVDKCME